MEKSLKGELFKYNPQDSSKYEDSFLDIDNQEKQVSTIDRYHSTESNHVWNLSNFNLNLK